MNLINLCKKIKSKLTITNEKSEILLAPTRASKAYPFGKGISILTPDLSGRNYYYEQGFIYGFELGEENVRKENEQLKYNLKCRDDELAESKAQVEKLKTCSRCMSNNKDLEEYPCKNCFKNGVYTKWH